MSPDTRDQYNETPLHRAAWDGHLHVVTYLLCAGACPNSATVSGKTPLHRASRRGNVDIQHALVEAGARVNVQNGTGETPLHWAVLGNSAAAASTLLSLGGDPGITTFSGFRPADLLRDSHDRELHKVLLAADGPF
jgi:ankyrin repeat protein